MTAVVYNEKNVYNKKFGPAIWLPQGYIMCNSCAINVIRNL